jgi:hypothetical protein
MEKSIGDKNMNDEEELQQVLKFLNLTEEQFDLVCDLAYNKVIKKRASADYQRKMTASEEIDSRRLLTL